MWFSDQRTRGRIVLADPKDLDGYLISDARGAFRP